MPMTGGRGSLSLSITLACFTTIVWLTLLPHVAGAVPGLNAVFFKDTPDQPGMFGSDPTYAWPWRAEVVPFLNTLYGNGETDSQYFSVRMTGWVLIKETDTQPVNFTTVTDDGCRLWIGDDLLVDAWRKQSHQTVGTAQDECTHTVTRTLDPGWHPIRFEYFEWDGAAGDLDPCQVKKNGVALGSDDLKTDGPLATDATPVTNLEVDGQTKTATVCDWATLKVNVDPNRRWAASIVATMWKAASEPDWHIGPPEAFQISSGPVWTRSGDGLSFGTGLPTWPWRNTDRVLLTVLVRYQGMPPQDAWTNIVELQPWNTVVHSDGIVIAYPGWPQPVTVKWTTDHKPCDNPTFAVTVDIIEVCSGDTVKHYSLTQNQPGPGSQVWDGSADNPYKYPNGHAPKGLYTYRVRVEHGCPYCADTDKSTRLTATISDGKFYWLEKNTVSGKVSVLVRYSLNLNTSNVAIRFYGPGLNELGGLDNQPGTAGTHWSDPLEIAALDLNGNIVSPLYCVVSALEDAGTAELNRGGDAKVALQKGTTQIEKLGLITPTPGDRFAYNDGLSALHMAKCSIIAQARPDTVPMQWSLSPIDGATIVIDVQWLGPPPPQDGVSVVNAEYVDLPPSNGSLGPATLTLAIPSFSYTENCPIRIFFSKTAANHANLLWGAFPGVGTPTPNWFYYWSQTGAGYGTYYYRPPPHVASVTAFTTEVDPPSWVVAIGDYCSNGPIPTGRWDNATGIDLFAWTCRHEAEHKRDFEWWWGAHQGSVPALDTDNDLIPDALEPGLGYTVQHDPSERDLVQYGEGFNDGEDYCMRHQATWINGTADNEDWACPGKQWPAQ